MATERYRKNVIYQILDENGRMVTDHSEKSALFYQEFKIRLGTIVDTNMQFNLDEFVQPISDLDSLSQPFSNEEIDVVILDLPHDKAPGPDGFNSLFYKKAWSTIKEDIYKVCKVISSSIRLISRVSIPLTSLWCPRKTTLNLLMTSGPYLFSTPPLRSSPNC
jgi:hypothetical protein